MSLIDQTKAEFKCDRCGAPLSIEELRVWCDEYHIELCYKCFQIIKLERMENTV
jgi:Zn finger protein HypA/HybF involved in hydrogenase expression